MSAKISDRLMYQAGMKRIPISGTFELTPMCNFSCKMCYVRKGPKEVAEKGGLLPVEKWLAWAEEAKQNGMLYLLITGGEPLTYPGFWELYEKLTQMGFLISINSNGSMFTEEVAKRFHEMPPRKINITLYGASNETYESLCGLGDGFERVTAGTAWLRKYNIPYKFNCSLTPYNCHELEAVQTLAKEHKVPLEIATYMFPPVRRSADLDAENARLTAEMAGYYSVENMYLQLEEEAFRRYAEGKMQYVEPPDLDIDSTNSESGKEMGCRAGRCSFWLDWQGNLSACGMINQPRYTLQNESFMTVWKRIVDDTNKIRCLSGCEGCKNQKMCHACISTAYCETGDINGRPTYVCKMIEAEAVACKEKLQKLNRK